MRLVDAIYRRLVALAETEPEKFVNLVEAVRGEQNAKYSIPGVTDVSGTVGGTIVVFIREHVTGHGLKIVMAEPKE